MVTSEEGAVGRVDYAAANEDSAELKQWLAACAQVTESAFNEWSVPHRQAFLINLYNAAMIQKILQRYPDMIPYGTSDGSLTTRSKIDLWSCSVNE